MCFYFPDRWTNSKMILKTIIVFLHELLRAQNLELFRTFKMF